MFVQEKKKEITFTQIEHHTMEITKKKRKIAITSTKIDISLLFNERNGIEQNHLTQYKK